MQLQCAHKKTKCIENDMQLNKLAGLILNFAGEDGSQRSPDDPHSAKTDERHAHACKVFCRM